MLVLLKIFSLCIYLIIFIILIAAGMKQHRGQTEVVQIYLDKEKTAEKKIRYAIKKMQKDEQLQLLVPVHEHSENILMIARNIQRKNPSILLLKVSQKKRPLLTQ